MIASPAPLPVRAAGCSQPWWFMRHGFGGAGDERILRRVSGWVCLLDMGREVDVKGGSWLLKYKTNVNFLLNMNINVKKFI